MADKSNFELLQAMPVDVKQEFVNNLTDNDALDLKHDITFMGRPKQQMPLGIWDTWLILAGRGFGKSFCGSHAVITWAKQTPGCRIAIVGETARDLSKVMIGGTSGIMHQCHPNFLPKWNKSTNTLTFPNGSTVESFNGTQPDQLRGPQFHYAWVDELAKYLNQEEMWDMLTFCLRLGDRPQTVITTTPRPTKLIRELVKAKTTKLVTGTTFENASNISNKVLDKWKEQYEGTRLGRQELHAEVLLDNVHALFNMNNIKQNRVAADTQHEYDKVVIAVDPSISANANSDDAGLAVVGIKGSHGYLIHDGTMAGSPNEWINQAIKLYYAFNCELLVYERNQGGIMTENMIHNVDPDINIESVHAYKGKSARAEPVSALYEQNRIHHIGTFNALETEITEWDPTEKQKSPNRLDALVYGFTNLFDLNDSEPMIW